MPDRTSLPTTGRGPLPPFEGAETLLDTLDSIVAEPGWFRPRQEWPLIRIASDPARHEFLKPLAPHYHTVTPTAWINEPTIGTGAASGTDSRDGVEGDQEADGSERGTELTAPEHLLNLLAKELRTRRPRVRDRHFRRFDFVHWLIHLRMDDDGGRARRQVRARHRRYLMGAADTRELSGALPTGTWWSLPLRAVAAAALLIGYAVIIRMLPHYRWLLRQPYLNQPTPAADVLSLAVNAATRRPDPAHRSELQKLLVHAFLADLEARAPARWWPPRWKRRARQPVLLFVDNVRDDAAAPPAAATAPDTNDGTEPNHADSLQESRAAEQLLELIASVRNRTKAPDPVVLVLSVPRVVEPQPSPETSVELSEEGAGNPLETWRVQHQVTEPAARTWVLQLGLPHGLAPGQDAERLAAQLSRHQPPRPGDLPTWAVAAAAAAALVVGLGGAGLWWYGQAQDRCGVLFPSDDTILQRHGQHCLGVTDLSDYIFEPPQTRILQGDRDRRESAAEHRDLRRAQERIRTYNRQVEASDLPYVTVVYFGSIADRRASGASVAAPRSELEGLALAQAKRIDDVENASIPSKRPLLRVLVANAGPGMKQAPRVARMIDELYRENLNEKHPIVAMVGLGQSVVEVEEAMQILEHTGMPMVGSITSYDGLPDASRNYFQVGPNNERMAQVAAYFAKRRFPEISSLLVIRSNAQNDTYSRNLAGEVEDAFGRAFADGREFADDTMAYETGSDRSGPSHARVADRICGHDGLVFYAGRAQDLGSIATELEDCVQAGSVPPIMAGDDVSRIVLEGALDGTGLTLYYVPMATSATSASGDCTAGRTQAWKSLFERNDALFGGTCPDSSDGRKLLIYDAVDVVLEATDEITDRTDDMSGVSGPSVRTALEQIHGENAVNGFSGVIDFGSTRDNRVPVNKAVSVLRISSGDTSPELVLRCGPLHIGDTSYPVSCPR